MPSTSEIATILALRMLEKSGVQEWTDEAKRIAIADAANHMADLLYTEGSLSMATNKILIPEMDGTPKQIVFGNHAGDFGPTAANDLRDATAGNRTNVELVLASLANSTSELTGAAQSAKFDFGAVRAPFYRVRCANEFAATPTAGNRVEFWLSPSHSATAGTGNEGGASGSSGAYTGYSNNIGASLKHCQYIGEFICTAQATATVQVGRGGLIVPKHRYGSLIVWNKSGAAFHSDDVECHIVFDPVFNQLQAAV